MTIAGKRYIAVPIAIFVSARGYISAEIVESERKIEFYLMIQPASFFRLRRKRTDNVGKLSQSGLNGLEGVKNDGTGEKGQKFAKYFCLMTEFDKCR